MGATLAVQSMRLFGARTAQKINGKLVIGVKIPMRAQGIKLFIQKREKDMHYFSTIMPKILGYFLYGAAFKLLWDWFVAETFNIANPSWANAVGIGILIRLIGDHYIPRDMEIF